MGFHDGSWCPVIVPDFYGPRCSQHPFDPYSLTHILHGFVFYAILVAIPGATATFFPLSWWWIHVGGVLTAIALEIVWEIFENSEFVMSRFRQTSGVSGDYEGDSFQNSLGDVVCATSGYWICVGFVAVGAPWAPFLWFAFSELVLAYLIRDSLILSSMQLIVNVEKIKKWQKDLIDQMEREKRKKDGRED
jgi:hypothetical protein